MTRLLSCKAENQTCRWKRPCMLIITFLFSNLCGVNYCVSPAEDTVCVCVRVSMCECVCLHVSHVTPHGCEAFYSTVFDSILQKANIFAQTATMS